MRLPALTAILLVSGSYAFACGPAIKDKAGPSGQVAFYLSPSGEKAGTVDVDEVIGAQVIECAGNGRVRTLYRGADIWLDGFRVTFGIAPGLDRAPPNLPRIGGGRGIHD